MTCWTCSKPGRKRREPDEPSIVSAHLPAPRLSAWQTEMSLVFVLAGRNFAPFSRARQMPDGILTLPGKCQLHSIRALAGPSHLRAAALFIIEAWLQPEMGTQGPRRLLGSTDQVRLWKHLPPHGLRGRGRHMFSAQPTAGWSWKGGILDGSEKRFYSPQ